MSSARLVARRERGFAAVAALLVLLIASTIAGAMAELARFEAVLAHQRGATTAALAAVDACVEDAVAVVPAGWTFTEVLLGADATAGTADDGVLPLAAGCTGMGRAAPGGVAPPRFLLEVEATHGGGRRRLQAVVRRHAEPGVPALLWVEAASIGRVTGSLALDGADPSRPLAPPRSTVAAAEDPAALDTWIAGQGGAIAVSPGTTAAMWAMPPPLAVLAARATSAGASSPAVTLVATPPATLALTLSAGDLSITDARFGAGVLIVDGVLRIAAPFAFTGIVAAPGGLQIDAPGIATVQGAVWLTTTGPDALVVEGGMSVVASAAALEAADALLPLPRRAVLASVLDF